MTTRATIANTKLEPDHYEKIEVKEKILNQEQAVASELEEKKEAHMIIVL